jgi:M-phase inducer tyrosine phosphatase
VSVTIFGPPRPRQLFSQNSISRRNGSPSHINVKKPVDQARPRKLFRRSLSMFEHPADVMKQEQQSSCEQPSGLPSIMDVDDTHDLRLPHFIPTDAPCSLPRINQDTLLGVINGDFDHVYDQYLLIDCRFEYEYYGGHIEGAENYNDKDNLARELFDPAPSSNTVLIFHCEYSQQRAPLMAQHIRKYDRTYNASQYPKLTYPEIYILDGGYSAFFKLHRSRCFPQNYVEMEDENHEHAMERGLGKMKQRKPLQRSATFAFGQKSCQMQDSPSRPTSVGSNPFSSMDLGSIARVPARRMASY